MPLLKPRQELGQKRVIVLRFCLFFKKWLICHPILFFAPYHRPFKSYIHFLMHHFLSQSPRYQGKGKAGQMSKHSQSSLQIWLARLSLLVKLKLFTIAEAEAEPFGDLERFHTNSK